MTAFDYFLLVWWLFTVTAAVATVGKPRQPLEGSTAAVAVALHAVFAVGLLASRGVLS